MNDLPSSSFRRVTIVGAGLIGGSWALALKRRNFAGRIVICDFPRIAARAIARNAVDEYEADLAAAVRDADLVILATPVGPILAELAAVASAAAENVLVTDTGSTKRAILNLARDLFREGKLFLGGHPLTGKEQSGIEHADPDLFEGTRYVLAPMREPDLEDARAKAFQDLLRGIGAEPVVIDAEEHDRALAFLSHFPQLLSTALAALVADTSPALPLELAAGGFRDMTRLAESPYSIWHDVWLTNADNVRSALDTFILRLQAMKEHLEDERLEVDFDEARRLRAEWRKLSPKAEDLNGDQGEQGLS
jgi:prephenate dehydrogenase